MHKNDLKKKKLPDAPGVYFFLGPKREILYIGKATSLKSRVRSYCAPDLKEKRSELIEKMVAEAKTIDWTVTDSVLEALILETNLIRTHKPTYNTIAKDDKSYNHLIITNEEYPRVLVVRGKDLTEKYTEEDIQYSFGPFPNGSLFREALKIVRRLFKFYDTERPVGAERTKMARGKIDFNRQIGLYPEAVSKEEYAKTIRHIRLFFEGKKAKLITELEREMHACAAQERFEEAEAIKRKIFALQHIQDVTLIKEDARVYRDPRNVRIEAYDIAHMAGKDMVGVMTVLEGGQPEKSEYRKFTVQSVSGANDTAALKEVLARRLRHDEWPLPQVIVADGGAAQKHAIEHVLRTHEVAIPVVGVVKDARHKPDRIIGPAKLVDEHKDAILLANAEAHRFAITFHRSRRSVRN